MSGSATRRVSKRCALACAATLVLGHAASAGSGGFGDPTEDEDLTELSLEELMDLEVTIASRSSQKLSEVPGAVYVITGDELRRSGHSSIPEALRMVPGFHVSHWFTGAWDVTSRGFGPGLSLTSLAYLNQLLVMIDGLVVYTPLFAGVWWPIQDIDLAEVDRIEIIRGPGGILWGSNAVHGVVHIITKKAADTQGLRVTLREGTDDRHGGVRYGGTLGESGHYRAWIKGADYDSLSNPFNDWDYDWKILKGGFRADWRAWKRDFSVWTRAWDGDFEDAGFDLNLFVPIQVTNEKRGVQLLGSMANPESRSRWQAWFATDQQDLDTLVDIGIDVLDVEYQRSFELGENETLSVGTGWRWVHSRLFGDDPAYLMFDPEESRQNTFRAYALDRIAFPAIDATLTFGATVEHNDFTQFEVQPTGRMTWMPSEDLMFWGSISRAVRTPSLEERHLSQTSFFIGSEDFHSEILWAYELGTRTQPVSWLAADLAVYFNDYDQLHFADFDAGTLQYQLTNDAEGKAYGLELALDLRLTESWSVRSAYTLHKGEYETRAGQELRTDNYSPEHNINLRSYLDLGNDWELDLGFYVVEDLGPGFKTAEYFRGDARLGWQPREDLALFLGIQNATKDTHSELDEFDQIRRTVYAGVSWSPGTGSK